MKRYILFLLICLLTFKVGFSQEIINNQGSVTNESIQQISIPGIDNILSLQMLNRGVSNFAILAQTGNMNKATVSQQNDVGPALSNQSYTVQSGNANELTVGQIGSGNLLLGFQLGYLATEAGIETGKKKDISDPPVSKSGYSIDGERNVLNTNQTGNYNGIMALQQGTDNSISAGQTGKNNYLFVLQKGSFNSVTDYNQENNSNSILFDSIVQIGDHLELKSHEASKPKPNQNIFMQSGTNLSLVINNDLLNSAGGVAINQTGRDMKVVIDQSYFSFPMK